MKISAEQFEALGRWIERLGRPDSYPWDAEMERAEARRLLVDDESPKPDPDLTMFGLLEAGDWFRTQAGQVGVKATELIKRRYGVDAFSACGSAFSTIFSNTAVRRLPKPEFPK